MPGMDGFETAKFIRGRERSRTTPIIFLTAVSTDIAQVARGYQAGAVDYVLKPFEPNMLRSKVSVFCDLERQRRARARADEMLLLAWRSLPTGAALVDADGRLLRANPVLQKLTERPGGQRRGRQHAGQARRSPGARRAAHRRAGRRDGAPGRRAPARRRRGPPGLRSSPGACASTTARSSRSSSRSTTCASAGAPRPRASAWPRSAPGRARAEAAYERERTIASTLQRDLLPRRLPDAPGVALAAHFSAGGEGTAVGGDWFDAFTLPGGRLGLVIGDVAGRGVAAAARMGQLRSVARAYAVEGHPRSTSWRG